MMRILVLALLIAGVAVMAPRYLSRVAEPLPAGDAAPAAVAPDAPPKPAYLENRVVLRADSLGHYTASALINGRQVDVLVDTGASTVALPLPQARRLGLSLPASAFTVEVSTANGRVRAAPVTLDEVRIGDVRVRKVAAVVLPADALDTALLGMTFLKQLRKFESDGDRMILTQ